MDGWAGRPAVRDPATDSRVRHPICLLLSLYIQPSLLLLLLYNIPGARSLAPEFHLLPRDLSFSCFFLLSLSLPSSHISGAPSIALCRLRINKESERDWKEMERDIYISHADCIYIDSLTRPRFRMLTYETVQGGGFGERSTHTKKKTLGRRRRLVR